VSRCRRRFVALPGAAAWRPRRALTCSSSTGLRRMWRERMLLTGTAVSASSVEKVLMTAVAALPVAPVLLPAAGGIYQDTRDDGHALRVSYHPEVELCIVSIWRGDACAGTVRLSRKDAAELIAGVADCLAYTPVPSWSTTTNVQATPTAKSLLRWVRALPRRPR
jgi:hypothetical protein